MGLTDIAVLSALAVIALYPLIKKAVLRARVQFGSANAGSPDAVEHWRQQWTSLLITLGREIESGLGELPRKEHALMLSRELMWEIIGGDGPAKGGKA